MLTKSQSSLLFTAFIGAIAFLIAVEATNIFATSPLAPKSYRQWYWTQVDQG